jgi:endonuclease I
MAAHDSAAALAAELAQALAVLAGAPERVYYDPDADQAAAEAYYAGIPTAGYAELVTETHVRTPGYRPAVELYPWVDLQLDLTVRSLYTGQQWNPAELIRADMEVQQMRDAALTRLSRAPDADPDQAEAMVETVLPYNCEHVVPQSWFDRRQPMRGDLHHLFACEARCNSFRGNTAYTEYADYPLPPAQAGPGPAGPSAGARVVRDDCGKRETAGFEPAHGKGAAARAVLYFALRYPGTLDEVPDERYTLLLDWHDANPVSLWEQHRNAAIHDRQGNRNPFIDHPTLAYDLLPTLIRPLDADD